MIYILINYINYFNLYYLIYSIKLGPQHACVAAWGHHGMGGGHADDLKIN